MNRIAIHDADGGKYPNLALMKLAAWHRAQGDVMERFVALNGKHPGRTWDDNPYVWVIEFQRI
ncbi:hypothetical protein LJC59_00150 [Desulfovibrio sp. OttesenSCG-928-A18]|nr:hypothetical protein [Desulfovibrio sp. OttesenSCG-928-A18]